MASNAWAQTSMFLVSLLGLKSMPCHAPALRGIGDAGFSQLIRFHCRVIELNVALGRAFPASRTVWGVSDMKLTHAVKLISPIVVCVTLSACATDYVSRLSDPGAGKPSVGYSEANVDPAMLMNGTYASKQLYGSSFGTFCMTDRCSQQAPLWSSGWTP